MAPDIPNEAAVQNAIAKLSSIEPADVFVRRTSTLTGTIVYHLIALKNAHAVERALLRVSLSYSAGTSYGAWLLPLKDVEELVRLASEG